MLVIEKRRDQQIIYVVSNVLTLVLFFRFSFFHQLFTPFSKGEKRNEKSRELLQLLDLPQRFNLPLPVDCTLSGLEIGTFVLFCVCCVLPIGGLHCTDTLISFLVCCNLFFFFSWLPSYVLQNGTFVAQISKCCAPRSSRCCFI